MDIEQIDDPRIVPFLVQIWMFATPVMYPSSIVPERWRWVLALNPMAGSRLQPTDCMLRSRG